MGTVFESNTTRIAFTREHSNPESVTIINDFTEETGPSTQGSGNLSDSKGFGLEDDEAVTEMTAVDENIITPLELDKALIVPNDEKIIIALLELDRLRQGQQDTEEDIEQMLDTIEKLIEIEEGDKMNIGQTTKDGSRTKAHKNKKKNKLRK